MARLPWITASEDFYPRPPRGGRRPWRKSNRTRFRISIHALREEGDDTLSTVHDAIVISIHALREEGDSVCQVNCTIFVISIHALREEGDALRPTLAAAFIYFYPRPPRGGRPALIGGNLTTSEFLSTPSARRATAKTERKPSAFVSLYTSLHKLQRDVCKPNRKITPLLAQTAGIPVRSVPGNHVCCRFALAGHQKISTLSWANSGCSPTCSTLVW